MFIELALELGIPVVPVRFTGGLPIAPITGKAEVPVGHGAQDYWIGEPLEADYLKSLPLKSRLQTVRSAINTLGGTNANERPNQPDEAFAAKVADFEAASGVNDVFAAMWQVLDERTDVSEETELLRMAAKIGEYVSDGTASGDWLGHIASLLLGSSIGANPQSGDKIEVSQASYPHLCDHSIDGAAVVPVVYAVEWLARAARDARPDLSVAEITDLKVLKGISLPGFLDGAVTSLSVVTEVVNESSTAATLVLRLSNASTGRPHYSCRVLLSAEAPTAPRIKPSSLGVSGGNAAANYGGVLFHGAKFQVLKSVVGLDADGCTALIDGVVAKGWAPESWATDPALLDGGLQLALLWNEFMVGRPSLPTSIGSIRVYSTPVAGPLVATLEARDSSESKSLCDIVISDADGNVAAQLVRVETHFMPGKKSAAPARS